MTIQALPLCSCYRTLLSWCCNIFNIPWNCTTRALFVLWSFFKIQSSDIVLLVVRFFNLSNRNRNLLHLLAGSLGLSHYRHHLYISRDSNRSSRTLCCRQMCNLCHFLCHFCTRYHLLAQSLEEHMLKKRSAILRLFIDKDNRCYSSALNDNSSHRSIRYYREMKCQLLFSTLNIK